MYDLCGVGRAVVVFSALGLMGAGDVIETPEVCGFVVGVE